MKYILNVKRSIHYITTIVVDAEDKGTAEDLAYDLAVKANSDKYEFLNDEHTVLSVTTNEGL